MAVGTFELNDDPGKYVERYMYGHLHTMIVLIEKLNLEEYRVIYANTLAIDYFSGNVLMSGEHFFRQYWRSIQSELTYLDENASSETKKNVQLENNKKMFELNLKSSESNIYFLEMRKLLTDKNEMCKLDDLRNKYESIIEHNLDPIITVDKSEKIVNGNLAIKSVFGYEKNEVLNELIYKYIQNDQVDLVKLLIKDGFQGISNEMPELNILHKENLFLPILIKILPVSSNGEIVELNIILKDLSKSYEYDEKFLNLSYQDQLTGLFNRKALKKDFIENRVIAQKDNQKIAIIHAGLDRFKLINEALGHNFADEILKSVGKRMASVCPGLCKVYRNGGDEFIMIVTNHTFEKTERIANLMLAEFKKPFHLNSYDYFVSASIGISVYPEDGQIIEGLIEKSEQAMFYVKKNGRSHFRFFADKMKSLSSDEVLLESHLRRAIEFNELQVYYQPQIDLKTGQINSFEALLRWNNRKFGFVSPGQFIQIAEDSGLIHSIGDWVLDQVCMQLKTWEEKGYREVSVAVNISPKQFRMSGFSTSVHESIVKHQIKPNALELEITESSLANMKETLSTLNELKVIGVRISVDDFGTGYSSLSYLKQYPIDIIKIDQSFIKDLELDEKNQVIAKTIINLAHNLGMDVIAEGVEKDLQATILLDAQCQKAQGFLYSKALPADEIVAKYFTV